MVGTSTETVVGFVTVTRDVIGTSTVARLEKTRVSVTVDKLVSELLMKVMTSVERTVEL